MASADNSAAVNGDNFVLEECSIPDDSDDDFRYEEVADEDDFSVQDGDENLEASLKALEEKNQDAKIIEDEKELKVGVVRRPEVVDDFVRNFLVRMGLTRTLECFQTEWYELKERGLLQVEDTEVVPDIYASNQLLNELVKRLRVDVKHHQDAAKKAKDMHIKLQKERDYHRMHYKRVVQEKEKLIVDIKRLKQHYMSYEPALKTLRQKYEVAMKEKMLTKLERDRAVGQVQGLQSTLAQMSPSRGQKSVRDKASNAPQTGVKQNLSSTEELPTTAGHPKDSDFPLDTGVNPLLPRHHTPCAHLTRTGGFRLANTTKAHALAVSALALHPRKEILATASDDKTWKIWALPSCDLIMAGEGHTDWISDCDFHPSGLKLGTSSGDSTVKIWDFTKGQCVATLADHTHAVWGCSWHSCGDFIASCSMDYTAKVWDLNSARCRQTLRGHADSVNSISFLSYSNTLCTCSADKTVSLWDARTGLCAHTFYGHVHSINNVVFNLKGDTLASCDSYGVVMLWDVRKASLMTTLDMGPHPANRVVFDPSSTVLAIASNDGIIKMFDIANGETATPLTGHEDAVQSVIFDKKGEYLVSCGSDTTIRLWS